MFSWTREPQRATVGRRALLSSLALVVLAWCGLLGRGEESPPAKGVSNTVKLTIDYGDGVQKQFSALPCPDETTVFSTLEAAAKHPRGIKFVHQGKGETILVTAIDDCKNEGRGRNWIFEVNGKLGDRSSGVFPLKAGDSVLWRFGKYK